MVRYFCALTGPAAGVAVEYLVALLEAKVRVRAMPLGAIELATQADTSARRQQLVDTFTTPMSSPFVNVVCATLDEPHGEARMIRGELVQPGSALAELWTVNVCNVALVPSLVAEVAPRVLSDEEVKHRRQVDDLLDNVAGPWPWPATNRPRVGRGHGRSAWHHMTLSRYDRVFCYHALDAAELLADGIAARHVHPRDLAPLLEAP